MLAAVSTGTLFAELILGILFGIVLMRAATSFQERWGRPPWGIPPWVWLILGFILGLIGVILYLVAQVVTKKSLTRAAGGTMAYGASPSVAPPPPLAPPIDPPDAHTWAPPEQPREHPSSE